MKPKILITERAGQLGNRLFQFGHFVAFAYEYGATVTHLCFDEYAHLFDVTARHAICRFPPRNHEIRRPAARHIQLGRAAERFTALSVKYRIPVISSRIVRLDWKANEMCSLDGAFFERVRRQRVVLAQGWLFRNDALFVRHGDVIRSFFRPCATLAAAARSVVTDARRGADYLVGIHVRRGDYADWRDGRYFYSLSQYTEMMTRIGAALHPRTVRFLVSSDERQDARAFGDLGITLGVGDAAIDLFSLAGCDFIAGPPSTFSMWASFSARTPLYIMERASDDISAQSFRVVDSEAWFRKDVK
jgi:hypothetical protein